MISYLMLSLSRLVRTRLCILFFALSTPLLANAGFFQWEVHTLPASTGAACANGTPYRFFVNRTPLSSNMQVFHEGGGACWGKDTCDGKPPLTAVNLGGISENYFSLLRSSTGALLAKISPLTGRLHAQSLPVQDWDMVYLPYCTGDMHLGNNVNTYNDGNGNTSVRHHKGHVNVKEAMKWVRDNMNRPNRLLISGQSAGSVGATANYSTIRSILNPKKAYLLADSGPIGSAPKNGSIKDYPSIGFFNAIRQPWGIEKADAGILPTQLAKLTDFDTNNMGSIYRSLAATYPNDRFGFMSFQADEIITAYLYTSFHTDSSLNNRLALYKKDLALLSAQLNQTNNAGYWLPYYRKILWSHLLTMIQFQGTGIEELGSDTAQSFILKLLDDSRSIPRAIEQDNKTDKDRHVSGFQDLYGIIPIDWFLDLFGKDLLGW